MQQGSHIIIIIIIIMPSTINYIDIAFMASKLNKNVNNSPNRRQQTSGNNSKGIITKSRIGVISYWF